MGTRAKVKKIATPAVEAQPRTWFDNPARALPLLICLALALRLAFLFSARNDIFSRYLVIDAEFYDHWAQQIAKGDLLGKGIFYQDPLYAYFLAGVYALFGHSLTVVRVIQAFLDAGTIALVFYIGKELCGSRAGLIAAAIVTCYGPMIYYTTLLDKTSFTTFLIAGALASFCAAHAAAKPRSYLFSGMAFGLASLTRGNLLLAGVALGLWEIVRDTKQWRTVAPRVAAFGLGLALLVGLVTARNYWVGRDWVPLTSNAGLNFFIGNNPYTVGTYIEPPFLHGVPDLEYSDSKAYAEFKTGRKLERPSEVSHYYFEQALDFIRADPAAWLRLTARKVLLSLHGFEIGETYSYYYFRDKFPIVGAGFFDFRTIGPLGLLGAVLVLFAGGLTELHIFTAAYLLSLGLFFVTGRYRFPLVLPFAVFAGAALASVPNLLKTSRPRLFCLAALLLVAGIGCNSRPQWFEERIRKPTLSTPYTIAGFLYAEKASDPRSAITELERASSIHPTAYTPYMYLARCYERLGEDQRAFDTYKKVIQLNPSNDEAYSDLGALMFKHQNYGMAMQAFAMALRYKPIDPTYRRNFETAKAMAARLGGSH